MPAAAIEVGQPAPDFTLQETDGTTHTLSALRGRAVLLAFIGHL
jgi:peroxiredoxin